MSRARTVGLGSLCAGLVILLAVPSGGAATAGTSAQAYARPSHMPGREVSFSAIPRFSKPPHKGSIVEPITAHPLDLEHGYVQREFFMSGRASAFRPRSEPSDGKWSVARTTSARYRTRILVRRPPASRFNGTVIVEWMNVTEGESAPDWDYLNPLLMRAGYAYVAVSDQAVGVNGGTTIFGQKTPGLVGSEPSRYGSLHHPGDKYSLDMFAQVGVALHDPRIAVRLLGGLKPQRILATGESQSAFYLTSFADAIQPRTHAYDGIFIHSRGGAPASFNGTIATAGKVRIRTDLNVPVFMFETETDLTLLGYAAAQQPNTPMIRTWEVAGTSHADRFLVGPYAKLLGCTTPVNDGPQHIVIQAAFKQFVRWVTDGTPPATPRRFAFASRHPAKLAHAADGNVRGGVRTPAVNVPVSRLSGAPPAGANETCSLFGSTKRFTKDQLARRYGTVARYRHDYRASLAKAIHRGYILKTERGLLIKKASKVSF